MFGNAVQFGYSLFADFFKERGKGVLVQPNIEPRATKATESGPSMEAGAKDFRGCPAAEVLARFRPANSTVNSRSWMTCPKAVNHTGTVEV